MQVQWDADCSVNMQNEKIEALNLTMRNLEEDITYQKTNFTFDEAIRGQMKLKSGDPTFDNLKGRYITASREQVRKYMDVDALFADPVEKMQFLDLRYQEGVSAKDLNHILKGKGVLKGMGDVFLEAGKLNNVNPVYLIVHALHETGDGKSMLAKKDNNFFGYNAIDKTAVKSGSNYAKAHGWNTREAGLWGAVEKISKGYINHPSGTQRTLYAMRWNPVSPGAHQYALDIAWAHAQVKRIYSQVSKLQQGNNLYQPKFIVPQYKNY